ncbi:MAG: response regulator, partial [Bacteroidota bacterium]
MPRNSKDVILLIEDNPADTLRTEIYLEEAINEYQLIKANTFREGAEALEKHENIDLVLLDLTLPDMQGGIKALERFLNENSDKPVIVLSGNTSDRLASLAVKAGAQDYLLKRPLTSFWLDRSIQHALQRFFTKKELEEANEALELYKNRTSIAQAISNLGEWELDLVTNKMIWSEQIYRLLNLPPTLEPRLQNYLEKVYPQDKDLVIDFFEKATRDDKIHSLEHRVILDGYQVRFVKLNARLISVERTQKLALIGSIQDISALRMSKQNEVDKVLAQQANTIWKQIVGELDFQVRAPLSKILNTLTVLFPESSSISAEHKSLRDQIYQASNDLSNSTTRILNFSVLLSDNLTLEKGPFKLKNLLQQMERLIHGSSKFLTPFKSFIPEAADQKLMGDQGKLLLLAYNIGWFCLLKSSNSNQLTCTSQVLLDTPDSTEGILEISFKDDQWKISPEATDRLLGKNQEIVPIDSVLKNWKEELELQFQVIKRLLPVLQGSLKANTNGQGTQIQ